MEFREIRQCDRESIEAVRRKWHHDFLSHSFCTLYLWQETLKCSLFLEEDFYIVQCEDEGSNSYFFPCGNRSQAAAFIETHIQEVDFKLLYMQKEDIMWLSHQFPGRFQFTRDDNHCEYLYSRAEQLGLCGGKFARIRNEMHHLQSRHQLRTEVLEGREMDAVCILQDWKEHRIRLGRPGQADYLVTEKIIREYKSLKMAGIIVYVDEVPQAFAAGGEIWGDTFAVQAAKVGIPMTGLLYYTLHELFRFISEKYTYINGDDDMGVAGIRLHKQKMRPCRINEVWKAVLL